MSTTLLRLLRPARRLPGSLLDKCNVKIHNILLQAPALLHVNRLNHQASPLVFNKMSKSQMDHTTDIDLKLKKLSQEIIYHGRISNFNIDHIIKDVEKSGTLTSMQGLFLLQSCCEIIDNKSPGERRELGDTVWKILKQLGIDLDVSHYNALLTIYLETEKDFSVLDFLSEMVDSGVQPNRVTYEKLISQYCYQGKVVEANQILKHMKAEQIPVNENVLSSFVYSYSILNDSEAVAKILEEMKTLKIEPTLKTYSSFMYAYAQKGDIENLRSTLKECEIKDIWVPNKVLLKTVYYLSINGFEEYIDEILSLTTQSVEFVREANKIMYKLLEKKQDTLAFKLFQSLPKQKRNHGKFFINALINFNIPMDKSAEYCKIIEEEGLDEYAFLQAIKKSIANNTYESSMTLINAWKELGGEIKEYYFHPILKTFGQTGQFEDIKKVLKQMILDYGINLSPDTLNKYVLYYIAKDSNEASFVLNSFPIPYHTKSNAILLYFLSQDDLHSAVRYLKCNPGLYNRDDIKSMLIQAFKNTEDVPSFVYILHYIYVKLLKNNESNNFDSIKFLDSCILKVMEFSADNKYLNLSFFRNLKRYGLSISPEVADEILKILGKDVSPKIVNIINNLKSGKLKLRPIQRAVQSSNYSLLNEQNIEDIASFDVKNLNNNLFHYLKKRELFYYCCVMNEDKVNEILKDFQTMNKELSEPIYVTLINMYVNLDKIQQAIYEFNKAKAKYPHFKLNKILNLKIMTNLVEKGEIEKAKNLISSVKPSNLYSIEFHVNKFLDAVAKYNDEQLLQTCFDQLIKHKYIRKVYPSTMKLLIKFHLSRNDGKAAYEKYEWLYNNYGRTPIPIDLIRQLVISNDNETLEQLVTFYEKTYGDCSFYLAIAYLEHNNLDKAISLMKNSYPSEKMVMYYAEIYYHSGQVDNLEKLFIVLNELNFDIECLCVLLLKSYRLCKDYKKCNELWLRMQEDNIKPSKKFYNLLDEILKNKDSEYDESVDKFYSALNNFDLNKAQKILDSIPMMYKSDCYSLLCHKHMSSLGNHMNVVKLWRDLNERFGLNLNSSTSEYILSKFLNHEDLDAIESVENFLSPKLKRELNFSYYLNKVHAKTESWNLFLKKLENKLNTKVSSPEDLNLHFQTITHTLLEHPDLFNHYKLLAYKFLDKKIDYLMYPLWIYYFLKEDSKAEELWSKYIKNPKYLYACKITHFLKEYNDPSLYVKLAELIQKSQFNKEMKFSFYSYLIKGCMELDHTEKYEYALECLQHGVLDIPMYEFHINLLADLQNGLEALGIPWPWSKKLNTLQ